MSLLTHTPPPSPCPCLQVLPAALAAAAAADATAFIITSGPSARTGTKSSGGGLFSFGGGRGPSGRAAQVAEQAGVGRYFVIRGAGLQPGAPASAAPGLVVAEAGSVDPQLAGQVSFNWVQAGAQLLGLQGQDMLFL